jgi:phosphatidylglycerophosphate synthase
MSPRATLLLAGALALSATVAAALALEAWLLLDPLYPAVAAGVLAAKVLLALGAVDRHHPHARLGGANLVTLARAGLVALLAALIREVPSDALAWTAIALGTSAACLDGVDGFLARRSRLVSAFGARFDMETDAFFILALSVLVWSTGNAGPWTVTAGSLRYLFVAAGWVLPWMRAPLSPTFRAKAMAVAQMVGLLVALAPIVPVPLRPWAAGLTLAGLVWSFAVDVGRLWRGREGVRTS